MTRRWGTTLLAAVLLLTSLVPASGAFANPTPEQTPTESTQVAEPDPEPTTEPSVEVGDLPTSIVKGTAIEVTATTTPAQPGLTVRLERRILPDGPWGTIRTSTLDDAGGVTFTASPNSYQTFEFRVAVDSDPVLVSRAQSVKVVATEVDPPTEPNPDQMVVVSDLPATLVKGETLRVSVSTEPALPAVAARLQRRESSGGSWSSIRSATLNSAGEAQMSAAPNSLQSFDFRVVVDTSPAVFSRVQTVRVVSGTSTSPAPTTPTFRASVSRVKPYQVRYSHRAGCPVPISSLRNLRVSYYDYAGVVRRGTVVVRSSAVDAVRSVFARSFRQKFPFKVIRPLEYYYAGGTRSPHNSDVAAMNAGNTGAFNCRPVVGNPYRMSQHSYGNAIDYNTIQNPYVTASRVYPDAGRPYLDRSYYRKGMILPGSVVASTMANRGWPWGARWSYPDYQHFSSNGG